MKNTLTTITACAALASATANAEIVLTDDLSAYGYIDTFYESVDDVSGGDGGAAEFELGFAFTPVDSPWSAVAEVSYDTDDTSTSFETVTITYAASDELSFTVGNILSYQGFETFDATGLFQYSYQGVGNSVVYSAGYAHGASADYVTDDFAAGVWAGETDDSLSLEVLLAYTGIEGLTAKFIYADDPAYETFNFWASYEINALTLAAEYTETEFDGGAEDDVLMFLGYYAFGDAGVTVRYSTGELGGVEFDRFTISPSYAFSDNVFGLVEWSLDDIDGGDEETLLAAELIFSF